MEIAGSNRKLKSIDHTFAGAFAGFCTRFISQPLDVLKIRFQVQNIKDGALKYKGLRNSIWLIFKEEGVTAFWKGHVPAQALSVVYGAVQFSTYEYSRSLMTGIVGNNSNINSENWIPGGNAGMTATFVSQPIDVVKTRTVMNTKKKRTRIFRLTLTMIEENGAKTFYKGVTPNMLSVYPQFGFTFLFYGLLKNLWDKFKFSESKTKSMFCGCVSGALAKVIVLPLDNVKRRLQMNGSKNFDVRYNGMIDCFQTVLKEQGVRALYRGVSPALLKAAVVTGSTFFVYEETCNFLEKYREKLKPGLSLNP